MQLACDAETFSRALLEAALAARAQAMHSSAQSMATAYYLKSNALTMDNWWSNLIVVKLIDVLVLSKHDLQRRRESLKCSLSQPHA